VKRLTRFLVRTFLPDHVLIERVSGREYLDFLVEKHLPGFHIHQNPPKGRRKAFPGLEGVATEGDVQEVMES
jgi:hypothetical protein